MIVSLGVLFSGTAATGQTPPPELFVAADSFTNGSASADPTIVRSRTVSVGLPLLTGLLPGDTRTFNLFDDASFVGIFQREEARSADSFSWSGSIQGETGSWFVLAVEDDVCVANVWVSSTGTYHVRFDGNGIHVIRETDLTQFPACGDGSDANVPEECTASRLPSCPLCMDDTGAIIDMLVVYTSAAREAQNGTNAINALIHSAEKATNQVYLNSSINNTTLRVVMTKELVGYTEVGDGFTDLDQLINGCDNKMDEVQFLRNAVGADAVSLIVSQAGGFCGLSGFEEDPPGVFRFAVREGPTGVQELAFNVVKASCAVGRLTFPHELAHNQGCRHDRGTDGFPGAFDYSHGYLDDCLRFKTIMVQNPFFRRILHFSNPDINWNGCPAELPPDCPPELANCPTGVAIDHVCDPQQCPNQLCTPDNCPREYPANNALSISKGAR